jgi:hypothetical protein
MSRVVVAVLAATAILIGGTITASAGQWGEDTQWTREELENNQIIGTSDTVSDVWNTVETVNIQAWRDPFDNIAFAINGHVVFTPGRTYAPVVAVQYGGGFALFHTGTNGRIYWMHPHDIYDDQQDYLRNLNNWTGWEPLDGDYVGMTVPGEAVSVARLHGPDQLFLVYRGIGADNAIYGNYISQGGTSPRQRLNGNSYSAPAITFNRRTSQLAVAIRGVTDDRIYLSRQTYGTSNWVGWVQVPGIQTDESPAFTSDESGNQILAVRGYDRRLSFNTWDYRYSRWSGWTGEVNNWQTNVYPSLSAVAGAVFVILTGLDNIVYYKQAYNGPN